MTRRNVVAGIFSLGCVACGLTFSACDDWEMRDGDWERMKWSHPSYATIKVDGVTYYDVPAVGGSFAFRCKNYKRPWLTNHTFVTSDYTWNSSLESYHDDSEGHYYNHEWCEVKAVSDTLKVLFRPNTGKVRQATIGVTAGDIFDSFRFWQQPAANASQSAE